MDLSPFGKIAFGDAWQTFDSMGNAYLSTIALPVPKAGQPVRFDTADIFVGKSTDGGCTYPGITKVASNSQNISDDKPSIAADMNPRSPYSNNVYVTWTQYKDAARGADENSRVQVVVARSSDGGATWSKPVGLSEETRAVFPGVPPRQGANVQVGPDGTVYVVWSDTINYRFVQQIAISKDGGKKFSDPITVAPIADDFSFPGGATFRQLGRILPSFSISPEGTLYLAWAERDAGHTVAVVTKSTDKGSTWSSPMVAGDVTGRSAFFVAVAAGPSNAVHVAFLAMDDVPDDTAPGADAVKYDAYVAQSSDGGDSFGAPFKISTKSSDPNVSSSHSLAVQFIGDYIFAVADASGLYVTWTDTRNGASCPAVDTVPPRRWPTPEHRRLSAGIRQRRHLPRYRAEPLTRVGARHRGVSLKRRLLDAQTRTGACRFPLLCIYEISKRSQAEFMIAPIARCQQASGGNPLMRTFAQSAIPERLRGLDCHRLLRLHRRLDRRDVLLRLQHHLQPRHH